MSAQDVNVREVPGNISIPDLSDYHGTVAELGLRVNALIQVYGGDSIISFDAGHNNIEAVLVTRASIDAHTKAVQTKAERRSSKRREKLQRRIAELQQELEDLHD